MGMIANYMYISNEDLKTLKKLDKKKVFETIENMYESEELSVSLDKMWDVLHFILTGVDSCAPLKNNPLRRSIVGINNFENVDGVGYIEKSRVSEIVLALEDFDFEKAMENFSMKACKKAELYPNIWEYEEEAEEIKEELTEHFESMKKFYKKILEQNGNVLVTIY